jgi:hypothetical protein
MQTPKKRAMFLVPVLAVGIGIASYWYFDLGHARWEHLTHYEGQPVDRLYQELGPPTTDEMGANGTRILEWQYLRYRVSVMIVDKDGQAVAVEPYRVKNGVTVCRYCPAASGSD